MLGVVQWSGQELLPYGGGRSRLCAIGSSRPKGRKHYAGLDLRWQIAGNYFGRLAQTKIRCI
jgi:hypothetical protein